MGHLRLKLRVGWACNSKTRQERLENLDFNQEL
jgi:hypothetical protein